MIASIIGVIIAAVVGALGGYSMVRESYRVGVRDGLTRASRHCLNLATGSRYEAAMKICDRIDRDIDDVVARREPTFEDLQSEGPVYGK